MRVSGGEASPSISKVLEAAAIAGVDDLVAGLEQVRVNAGVGH
jgi:2-oxoisovalerate dehydrogenase E1 component